MGLLRLAVLGAPEVFHDGSRLTFSLRKAQALLLYLAVEGGLHSRSKLAAFLWPDSDPPDARRTLRNAIMLLRSLLADPNPSTAPASLSPGQDAHLLSQGELIGLNPQAPLELDLAVVQQAYTAAQRFSTPPSEPQRVTLVAQVQQALALVRGPFLDGFWLREETAFDEWVQQQQQQWQVRLQLLCERLSAWQEAGFELEQARATLLRWLALDRLSEEASQRLMRVHLALGDASAALQVYVTLRARLPEDLLEDLWLAELARLLPELRVRYPDLPAPTEDELTARGQLFEAVARLVDALARRAPLVLLLDDLQWADGASLDLLRYLGYAWRGHGSRVLLLGAVRSEGLELNPQLSAGLFIL